jgi:outer membrane protein
MTRDGGWNTGGPGTCRQESGQGVYRTKASTKNRSEDNGKNKPESGRRRAGKRAAMIGVGRVARMPLLFFFLLTLSGVGPLQAQQTITLSLVQARERAVEHNAELALAQREVDMAAAARLEAWSGYLPHLALSQQVLRSNDAVSAFGFKLKQESFTQADFAIGSLNKPEAITDFQTALEARQRLFGGGRTVYGHQMANAALAATQAQLARRRQQVMQRTEQAYWGLVLAREKAGVARRGVEAAQALAAVVQARYKAEAAPRVDVLAAQVRVAERQDEELAALDLAADASDELGLALGAAAGLEFVPTDSLYSRPAIYDLPVLLARALTSRPDLKAMRYQSKAATKGVRLAQAAYLPQVDAFARMALDADKAWARQGESWTVGAVLRWDLFAGLHSAGAIKQAKARQGQAQVKADHLAGEIDRQVRRSWRALVSSQRRVEIGQGALDQANERLRIVQRQYGQGMLNAASVLDAETSLNRARFRLLQALYAQNVASGQLELALGAPLE